MAAAALSESAARARRSATSWLTSPETWVWLGVWILTRLFVLARVGYWSQPDEIDYADVNQYMVWSDQISETGSLPSDDAWQYPPAAAFLMLLPRVAGGEYGLGFVIAMLGFDLLGLILLAALARRSGRATGVWLWLVGVPLLGTLSVLRFDLVPTVLAVAGLVALHRRPAWVGAMAGLGAMLKVWPIVILLGEWERGRLLRGALFAAGTIAAVLAAAAVAFGDPLTFLGSQGGRGLQVEAVAAAPWQLREVLVGTPVPELLRYGAWEIPSGAADAVASLLDLAGVAVLAGAAVWWWARERAIRGGREDLASVELGRDLVFTVVLLLVIVSRVLSPQYLLWLLGLAAILLSSETTSLRRPAWIVIGALILTPAVYGSPANALIRNLALVLAAADAIRILLERLREPASRPPGG